MVLAGFALLASMLWWLPAPGLDGALWVAASRGILPYHLALPLLAALCCIAPLRRAPGNDWWLVLLGALWTMAAWVAMFTWPRAAGASFASAGLLVSFFFSLFYTLFALVLAVRDPLPLGSPIARLVYFSRFGQMRALQRLAEQWDLQVTGPVGPDHAMYVAGTWYGRPLRIESGALYAFSRTQLPYGYLRVALGTQVQPWPLLVQTGVPDPQHARERAYMAAAFIQDATQQALDLSILSGRTRTARLWVRPGSAPSAGAVELLRRALESGTRFLNNAFWAGNQRLLFTHGDGLHFERYHMFRLTERVDDLEQLLGWLATVLSALEHGGLCSPGPVRAPEEGTLPIVPA